MRGRPRPRGQTPLGTIIKAPVEEEKNKAVEMGPMDPANKGKIDAE